MSDDENMYTKLTFEGRLYIIPTFTLILVCTNAAHHWYILVGETNLTVYSYHGNHYMSSR